MNLPLAWRWFRGRGRVGRRLRVSSGLWCRWCRGDGRLPWRPEHPVAGAVMLEGADEADGDDGDAELLGEAEAAILEFVDVAIAGALGFGKNDEAGAAID